MENEGGETVVLPFDFNYYKPDTLQEAIELFQTLNQEGKHTQFFSGGTELITLGRIDLAYADAVIDIKNIKELRVIHEYGDRIVLGSALSLTEVEEANLFPLLTKTASEVADHTARGKITLGGNICARIYYRETVLPFLLADSLVLVAGIDGIKNVPINEIFNQQLQLKTGEIIVQLEINRKWREAPFVSIKRRQQWKTGYPLVTINGLKADGEIRVAVSGLCPFPFRSREMEFALNNQHTSFEERIGRAIEMVPGPILDDVEGSAEFRLFVLKNLLYNVMAALGSGGE
jgi:carbon-monoxide dehydrogenase medium subunit